jgi:choline-sulfatase
MRKAMIILLIAVCLAAASCTIKQEVAKAEDPLVCKDCNIILVSLDALQYNYIHANGYPLNITPTIDSIEGHGYSFTEAVSAASWTVPATMSWWTGVYPSQHKVVNKYSVYSPAGEKVTSNLKNLSPEIRTLAEVLRDNGYATAGFTGDAGVNGVFGNSQGFDVYYDKSSPFSGLEASAPQALAWLQANKDRKFFMFLHGYDFHGQYEPEKGFDFRFVNRNYSGPYNGSRLQQEMLREEGLQYGFVNVSSDDIAFWRAIYAEKVNRADAKFRAFMDEFEKLNISGKTIFILTSDHGTEQFEHGRIDHGFSLYDELIHVPLIIRYPGQEKGISINSQVSTVDLMPTVLDIAGIAPDGGLEQQMKGSSLLPVISGERAGYDAFSETDYRLYTYKRSIRTPEGWKYIYTLESKKGELYNLTTDPSEKVDLAVVEEKTAYELEQRLFAHLRDIGSDPEGDYVLGCSPVYGTQCKG